ncbi:MAG: CinA family protein [Gammaproteobacteria bacterium]
MPNNNAMLNEELLRLAKEAGGLAARRGAVLSSAESCTGGLVAAALTHWPGSSRWFGRGFVCYSNEAKTEMLQVPPPLLREFGAVSEQTAAAMCAGAGDFSMSITGIAGPSGGNGEKPAGTVCFAWRAGGATKTETHYFKGVREKVRLQAACHALREITKMLKEIPAKTPE